MCLYTAQQKEKKRKREKSQEERQKAISLLGLVDMQKIRADSSRSCTARQNDEVHDL